MSEEVGGFVIFDFATCRTLAFPVGIRGFRKVDAVFFRERLEDRFHSRFLVDVQIVDFEIADDADAYGRTVVPCGVRPDDVVAAGAALVDRSALSDDVVVADVAPAARYGMVAVGRAEERSVVKVFEVVFGGMVEHDFLDFPGFFERPDEFVAVFGADGLDRFVLSGKRRRDMRFDACGLLTGRLGGRADFAFAFGGEFFEIGLPGRGILVPVSFVGTPVGAAYDSRSSDGCGNRGRGGDFEPERS